MLVAALHGLPGAQRTAGTGMPNFRPEVLHLLFSAYILSEL